MALVRSDARTASQQIRKATWRSETPKQNRRPGRPSKYKPEFAERVTDYCLLGATNEELARIFKVRDTTIPEWINRYPEFAEAIKRGREIADANVAQALYRRAIGWTQPAVKIVADAKTGAEHVVHYEEHFPPDTAAAFIWLKNRQPGKWRDKKEVHETSDVRHSGKVEYTLSPEARAILDETLAELGKGLSNGAGRGNGGGVQS